jgi:hypothetical protein
LSLQDSRDVSINGERAVMLRARLVERV